MIQSNHSGNKDNKSESFTLLAKNITKDISAKIDKLETLLDNGNKNLLFLPQKIASKTKTKTEKNDTKGNTETKVVKTDEASKLATEVKTDESSNQEKDSNPRNFGENLNSSLKGTDRNPLMKQTTIENRHQFQEILDKSKAFIKNGKNSKFSMKLNPEKLGRVFVDLAIEKGLMSAKFVVESSEAKTLLLQNIETIKSQLEESGVEISKFQVDVRSEQQKFKEKNDNDDNKNAGIANANLNPQDLIDDYALNSMSQHIGSLNMVV